MPASDHLHFPFEIYVGGGPGSSLADRLQFYDSDPEGPD